MALYRREKSKVWWIDVTAPNGQRHRVTTRTTNKQLANEFEAKFVTDLYKTQRLGLQGDRRFSEAIKVLLAEKEGKDVYIEYERQLGWWLEQFGDILVKDITKGLILDTIALKEATVSKATCNRYLSALRVCLNLVKKKHGWIEQVPDFFMNQESKGRVRWLKPDEVARLISSLPEHLRGPAVLALATGLRRSVVTGLKWSQVDLVRKVITIDGEHMKNGEDLGIPLSEMAVAVLREQIGKNVENVFTYCGRSFKRCSEKTWDKALEKAGIEDFRWHDLRHTWATLMTQAGVPDAVLMTLGAWKTLSMVRRYAHHATESVRPHAQAVDGALSGVMSQILPHPPTGVNVHPLRRVM